MCQCTYTLGLSRKAWKASLELAAADENYPGAACCYARTAREAAVLSFAEAEAPASAEASKMHFLVVH